MSFWEKVRAYANVKVREAYMRKQHNDLKCRCCNTWASEVSGYKSIESEGYTGEIFRTQCKRCSQWTRWDARSGFIVTLADVQPEMET